MSAVGPWEFGWDALVALGTLALAGATLTLALATRSLAKETAEEVEHSAHQVEEARRQVEVAQAQAEHARRQVDLAQQQTRIAQLTLSAQIRPVLIDVPLDLARAEPIFYPDREEPIGGNPGAVHVVAADRTFRISVPVRNAGAGLAMIRGISLSVRDAVPPPQTMIRPANVAPNERSRVSFFGSADEDPRLEPVLEAIASGQLSVEIGYADLSGQQYTISVFNVVFRSQAHWNWEIRQVHLKEPDGEAPFAGSAPTA